MRIHADLADILRETPEILPLVLADAQSRVSVPAPRRRHCCVPWPLPPMTQADLDRVHRILLGPVPLYGYSRAIRIRLPIGAKIPHDDAWRFGAVSPPSDDPGPERILQIPGEAWFRAEELAWSRDIPVMSVIRGAISEPALPRAFVAESRVVALSLEYANLYRKLRPSPEILQSAISEDIRTPNRVRTTVWLPPGIVWPAPRSRNRILAGALEVIASARGRDCSIPDAAAAIRGVTG